MIAVEGWHRPVCWNSISRMVNYRLAVTLVFALQMAAVTGEVEGAPDSLEAAALPAGARARIGL